MTTDDDLLLYYYRDGLDAAGRARIGAAISNDPALAQRLQGLVARLDAAAALPEVPVPAHAQQRWQIALERAARNDSVRDTARVPRVGRFPPRWPAAAAVAVLAIVATLQLIERPSPDQTAEVATPVSVSAFERGLKWHLTSTERQLAGLGSAKPEERTRLVAALISQNRMFVLTAEHAGEAQLARVLRAFAPILESLAHDGGDGSANIAQLSFELRVMQGRLNAGADSASKTTTL